MRFGPLCSLFFLVNSYSGLKQYIIVMCFFLFFFEKSLGKDWSLSPPALGQIHNLKSEWFVCGIQLPIANGMDLCREYRSPTKEDY